MAILPAQDPGTYFRRLTAKLSTVLAGVKRFILWDYRRGVWQYDVMCAIIVAFIFFSPRQWFRDQPRIPRASQVTSLPSHGESVFWLDTELVVSYPENQRIAQLSKVLTARTGRTQLVTRIEPVLDSEQELKGYMAFAKP
jgi:hypothetical protein